MFRHLKRLVAAAFAAALMIVAFPAAASADDPTVVMIGGSAVLPAGLEEHLDACTTGAVERFAGANRYATAAAIAAEMGAADIVFLATGENFPDAVAVGPIAALRGAPVLLTRGDVLPSETRSALNTLAPSLVVIVGGNAVISNAVEQDVAASFPTVRIAGENRYETASQLSEWHFDTPATVGTVVVATGENYLDALVAGPLATRANAPLLLTPKNTLTSATISEIHRLAPSKVIVMGARGVVTSAVEASIEALGPSVERVDGSSRYHTAANAAAMAAGTGDVFLVTSDDFADGLAAVPLANGAPIVFAGSGKFPAPTASAVSARVGHACDEWAPPYPAVGSGKRVIYTLSGHRLWMIDENENLVDTYEVTGREGIPHPGTYEVYSKSVKAWAPYGGITMRHMVRFVRPGTWGNQWAYGFHSIPRYPNGNPLQTEDELGGYGSGGCVRQADHKAEAMYRWADIGTTVIVLP